jgi:hypothetical protein
VIHIKVGKKCSLARLECDSCLSFSFLFVFKKRPHDLLGAGRYLRHYLTVYGWWSTIVKDESGSADVCPKCRLWASAPHPKKSSREPSEN